MDNLLANDVVDPLARLAHINILSKVLCDDSILLIRNKMDVGFRLATSTDTKVRKQALKLLEDALIAYEHYASHFPLDYERCLSQVGTFVYLIAFLYQTGPLRHNQSL